MDTSVSYMRGRVEVPVTPVNFTVTKLETGEKIPFAFRERDGEDGQFTGFTDRTRVDEIILMKEE